jgi:hypothetical protein
MQAVVIFVGLFAVIIQGSKTKTTIENLVLYG